ncbi:hypothetical protein [Sulfurovum sp.]|uniref:hypothetical protein n=1 Tax=Sulfurovum sp. TaxID=1969726 RepID=UPI00356888C1
MKKMISTLILLSSGILNGYILIICTGYMHSFDITFDLITWVIPLLAEYKLIYFGKLTLHVINAILLAIPAIPIFLLFGFALTYGLRSNPTMMIWISSAGIILVFLYSTIRYHGSFVGFAIDAAVIISLNILVLTTISRIIKARANA